MSDAITGMDADDRAGSPAHPTTAANNQHIIVPFDLLQTVLDMVDMTWLEAEEAQATRPAKRTAKVSEAAYKTPGTDQRRIGHVEVSQERLTCHLWAYDTSGGEYTTGDQFVCGRTPQEARLLARLAKEDMLHGPGTLEPGQWLREQLEDAC